MMLNWSAFTNSMGTLTSHARINENGLFSTSAEFGQIRIRSTDTGTETRNKLGKPIGP